MASPELAKLQIHLRWMRGGGGGGGSWAASTIAYTRHPKEYIMTSKAITQKYENAKAEL